MGLFRTILGYLRRKVMGESDRVTIRIAVSVNANGDWHAEGSHGWSDEDILAQVTGNVSSDTNLQTYLIELEIPKPRVQIIRLPSPEQQITPISYGIREVQG